MKNAFDGFINRLDTTEEGIIELEETSVETSKLKRREKRMKRTE